MRSQRFLFYNSEVKLGAEYSQRIHSNISEVKQGTDRSQRFHFNCSEVKQRISVVRDFGLMVVS